MRDGMSPIMSGAAQNDPFASASSSSHSPPTAHTAPSTDPPRPHRQANIPVTTTDSPHGNRNGNVNSSAKHGSPSPNDWYTEGPGRRVGYEDMTAIDWIFEYTKERQRLRVLSSSASGLLGYLRILMDASEIWIILVLTGLLVGAIAAGINVTSDWLGDLKLGFCSSGPEGGHFYLNKGFCCYGYDQGSNCAGWKYWSDALGVQGAGGKWFIEYFFYLLFSVSLDSSAKPSWVCLSVTLAQTSNHVFLDNTGMLRSAARARVRHLCQT